VEPTSIESSLNSGETGAASVTVTNTGDANLYYSITATQTSGPQRDREGGGRSLRHTKEDKKIGGPAR
jgi:hypothetical protein